MQRSVDIAFACPGEVSPTITTEVTGGKFGDNLNAHAKSTGTGNRSGGCSESAPARWTYCDDLNATPTSDANGEVLSYSPEGEALEAYKYSDGSEDTLKLLPFPGWVISYSVDLADIVVTSRVPIGNAPTHQKYRIWCETDPGEPSDRLKEQLVWVSLITPEAIAQRFDLYAQAVALLPQPQVNFVDPDLDYDWLWVQIPHHVATPTPQVIRVEQSDTDPSGWADGNEVTAWIELHPVAFNMQMQPEAGEEELASCDLATATSDEGCEIRFTHASVITKSDMFTGIASMDWMVESNAVTLNGFGPISTHTGFEVQVAEAMAVTIY